MRTGLFIVIAAFAACAVTSCASGEEAADQRPLPAWFVEQRAALEAEGYPDLANVPDRVDANTRQPYWDGVTAELDSARRDLQTSPRAERPPTAEEQAAEAAAFDEGARNALETTRRQH